MYNGSEFTPGETISGEHKWYLTQTVNHCESPPDTSVLLIKDQIPDPVADDVGICSDEAVPALTASGQNITWYADAGLSILVHTGTSFTPRVTDPGTYTWYVIQANGKCISSTATSTLKIKSRPTANAVQDSEICEGETIEIGSYSTDGHSYSWRHQDSTSVISVVSNPELTPVTSSTYILSVTLDSTGAF